MNKHLEIKMLAIAKAIGVLENELAEQAVTFDTKNNIITLRNLDTFLCNEDYLWAIRQDGTSLVVFDKTHKEEILSELGNLNNLFFYLIINDDLFFEDRHFAIINARKL